MHWPTRRARRVARATSETEKAEAGRKDSEKWGQEVSHVLRRYHLPSVKVAEKTREPDATLMAPIRKGRRSPTTKAWYQAWEKYERYLSLARKQAVAADIGSGLEYFRVLKHEPATLGKLEDFESAFAFMGECWGSADHLRVLVYPVSKWS